MFNKRLSCQSEPLSVDLYNKYVKSILLIDILYQYGNVHCTCISSIVRHSMSKEGDVMKNHLSYESVFNTTCTYTQSCVWSA